MFGITPAYLLYFGRSKVNMKSMTPKDTARELWKSSGATHASAGMKIRIVWIYNTGRVFSPE